MTRDTFSLIVSLLETIAGIFSIVVSYLTIGVESDKKKKQLYLMCHQNAKQPVIFATTHRFQFRKCF